MTAQEIFEKLGFNQIENNSMFISYYKETEYEEITIAFSKTYKELCIYNGFNHSVWIKYEWFNAIKQQMIELGWIK